MSPLCSLDEGMAAASIHSCLLPVSFGVEGIMPANIDDADHGWDRRPALNPKQGRTVRPHVPPSS